MKNTLIIACMVLTLSVFAQTRIYAPKELRDKSCIKTTAVFEAENLSSDSQKSQKNMDSYESYLIGETYYDLQSNSSVQNRMFLYPDGFIGGTFTLGNNFPGFSDRGTGYNNFESTDWGPLPTTRIETERCGWPSYAPWGENGEIVVAHYSGASIDGLILSKRTTKGTGSWVELDIMGPAGHALLWPRITTSGPNHNTIHLIAVTTPIANGGSLYQGQDGALVYSRSSDGGVTWDVENTVIDGLGSAFYNGFEGDIYEFAYPKANTLALLIGNDWTDLVLLKSTDNGNTWTKTVVWEHPYPFFDPNNMIVTDTFYCADGSHSLALDNSGKAHVAFGINRAQCDGSVQYWFPLVDGICYWNEDMPGFSDNLNALSPYGDAGSELVEDYNLIGWMQDINGNGVLDLLDDVAAYFLGASSMPQLVIDDQFQVFLIYSSITESYESVSQNYRHIWARGSNDNGLSWGDFLDLNNSLIYIFDECVFPSCSPTTDENIHFLYQGDNEPGMAVRGDEDPYGENYIYHYSISKTDIVVPNPGNMLSGVITDIDGGAGLGGATISIEGTSFTTTSSSGGTYSINDIPAGTYTVYCSKTGYIEESAIVVITNSNVTIQNFELILIEPPGDGAIGETYYDLQSNASMQNRIYKYADGTIGTTWTMGMDFPAFPDRGTGYNYYNGIDWEAFPTTTIESIRTGWPSYMPFGASGEMVVSHDFSAGSLNLVSREEKGIGEWSEVEFLGPTGINISWNRTITTGTNFNTIQVLALTWPTSSAGTLYQGLDGALLYSRSTDGGTTWDQENIILDGMSSSEYFGFTADNYEWATKDDQIAFLVGSPWTDLFLMKSPDNGGSWTKTLIWEHPYPLFNPNSPIVTDTFYCADGAHSISFDESGKIHIAFGISRAYSDGSATNLIPEVDGIAYWNEDMLAFTNNHNALSPYGDPGSELIEDYNLVGWSQDLNGNGELDILGDWGEYYLGLSSMPQLVVDEENNIFLVYSSVTEGYNNGLQNYRHLWARGFNFYTQTWGDFVDLNSDLVYLFSECVFPSSSPTSDDQIHLIFMEDSEPGLAVRGDEDDFGANQIKYMNVLKADLIPELGMGILVGTVTEAISSDPISDASIYVQGTTFITSTGVDGTYEITGIPSGSYLVSCEKPGYSPETVILEIVGNSTTTKNFQLEDPEPPVEGQIGQTYFDLQSNSSTQNRIYKYDDGTIGAIWTMGFEFPACPDRGTGYNYYDGIDWGSFPDDGIEPDRTGWPSYAPWGEDGEIVVAHYSGAAIDGLVISSREGKGAGDWSFVNYIGPTASNYYLWPRAMSGGIDHNDLHLIAITAPVENGGGTYQGMDGALLYSRSPDGGLTWDYQHVLLDEINADYYNGFSGDSYEIQTQGENVAFLVGDEWTGLALMKSSDNGDTWSKTIIWDHPYPLFDPNNPIVTDTFYNVDGAHSLAFDQNGKVHVAFGINRSLSDGASLSWFPEVDGIGYWNEDMPSFSNNLNALNPYGGTGSELIEDYNLIGWSQDLNGNGQLDFEDDWGLYYLGVSSMPQLVIDEMNNVFLVYSSVTESYTGGMTNQNYRHLWARGSNDNGQSWGEFVHLTAGLIYILSECVFPSLSPTTDNSLHLIYQEDNEPGLAVRGDEDPFDLNHIVYMNVLKSDIITLIPGGFLEGTVTMAGSGIPIENATVSLTGTSFSVVTDTDGYYYISNVLPGNYTAVCTKMGYLTVSADITIEVGVLTTQDFELEEAIDLNPPENLIASIVGQNDVLLEWDSPISGSPLGYHVYRNNENIGFYTTTEATDLEIAPGNYEYFTTAVYDVGESGPSNIVVIYAPEPLFPPINLIASVDDNDVTLMWDPPLSGLPPLGYNVFRDLILLDYTTVTYYLDEDLEPGTYSYYLTSVNGGESDFSEIVEVYIPEPCNPPENVTAVLIDNSDLHVTWDPPTTGSPIGYNLYQNNVLIDLIYTTEIYFYDLIPGVYEICVSSVCLDGESELSCADPVTISLAPPLNMEAEISGSNIILSWDEPEEKSLLGYNVYHSYDNGEFVLFAYVTQTSCIFTDAEVGLHKFFAAAVYDEGESDPSNIVEVLITNIQKNIAKGLKIHPNPASAFVYIEADIKIESLKIYNHSGDVIGNIIINDNFYKINVSQFSSGLYFFGIKTSDGIISKRVIIK